MVDERTIVNQNRYKKYEEIRDSQGMKDADVSAKTGITQSVLSDWKAGRATPAFGNIVKIAECLGVAANDFEVSKEGEPT